MSLHDADEAPNTHYDHLFAAEQKRNPQESLVQKLGKRAVRWFKDMNQKRNMEKAERAYNGSIAEIHAIVDQQMPQETHQAEPVLGSPGVYRSHFADEQLRTEVTENDIDDVMSHAVRRARQNLGALPVLTMHQEQTSDHASVVEPPLPGETQDLRHTTPQEDEALLERLRQAYIQPAQEPDRSGHIHRIPQDDDRLVGTSGR